MCDAQLPRGASHFHPIHTQVFGVEELVSAAQHEAAGWEALCSATTVIPQMAVRRGKREGNALNPLKGRNVAGKSPETNLSESLKCKTLASGKFGQFLERAGWSQLLGRAHPCAGRGLPSPGGCTLGITVAASFVLILEISRGWGERGRSVLFNKDCTAALGNGAQTTTACKCLKARCCQVHTGLHNATVRNSKEKPPP